MSSRPKPRPRARAPLAPQPPSTSNAQSSASSDLASQPTLSALEQEDAFFIRKRDPKDWALLRKAAAAAGEYFQLTCFPSHPCQHAPCSACVETNGRKRKSSDESSEEEEDTPRVRNNKKKKAPLKKQSQLDWTKQKPADIILSSDSDDDFEILEGKMRSRTTDDEEDEAPRTGRLRRQRSRSLTPPPALSQYEIQRARDAVNQFVGMHRRAPSPTDDTDESIGAVVLDPELALIAQQAKQEAALAYTTAPRVNDNSDIVKLKVVWRPHPLNPNGRQEQWEFTQKRHDNFFLLFSDIADTAGIPESNLVVCFNGKQVFPSSNPFGMGIWSEAEFDGCDRVTYEHIQKNKRVRSPSVIPHDSHDFQRDRSASLEMLSEAEAENDGGAAEYEHEPEEETPGQAFHLTVRSAKTSGDISLLVRPTTKCGAIVRAFLKKAGLDSQYSANPLPVKGRGKRGAAAVRKMPALSVDGDKMGSDVEIGEADLEDGDMVEVVDL
ncbi:uncharacterized protein BXZ73DRAFT_50619 [Epithele typhae]|uniref:uncharacterized protein n=1 Tax=Epithele typhae TaxID=378194 RepID=UPI0020087F0E|nr:uncharacterized protein BXZ73DRAFT_50619 [Epithele typhae]KAH9924305.1 hypothetical protein BXZ73DRAFT_50619 [Epithele typhae]